MNKWITFFKKTALLFLMCLAMACKNKEGNKTIFKTENRVTAEVIKKGFSNFPTEKLLQEKNTVHLYKTRDYSSIWNNKNLRKSFLQQLKKADEEGLFFKDYHGKKLLKLLQKDKKRSEKERFSLEILLTDAFFQYAKDLYYGKLDPKKMYEIWGVERKKIDFVELFKEAVEKDQIEQILSELKPQNEIYKGLKKSLLIYRKKKKKKDLSKIETGKIIKPGEKDLRIPKLAKRLKKSGILDENYSSPNNLYDKELQIAIKKFQRKKGLVTDKVIGNSTIKELNMGARQRYNQILANLERWRWYPRELGNHYILINIPNYKLVVIKNGNTIQEHNIIAGDKTHHTPVFSDSIEYIVLNPEWHIPSSIRNAEIIPSASANPNYLGSRNIYITDPNDNKIDPSTINWSSGEARNYRFTQSAGPTNSLGRVKIIYPNNYAIYLHDTPAQALFNQNLRAESHGCVRVENAINLAAYILSDQEKWSMEKIKKVISSRKTRQIAVTQPIYVHHFYWTAWRENDKTIFINDIYSLDKAIYTALKK